jgi:hypothetical protein
MPPSDSVVFVSAVEEVFASLEGRSVGRLESKRDEHPKRTRWSYSLALQRCSRSNAHATPTRPTRLLRAAIATIAPTPISSPRSHKTHPSLLAVPSPGMRSLSSPTTPHHLKTRSSAKSRPIHRQVDHSTRSPFPRTSDLEPQIATNKTQQNPTRPNKTQQDTTRPKKYPTRPNKTLQSSTRPNKVRQDSTKISKVWG